MRCRCRLLSRTVVVALLTTLVLGGCGVIPRDPDGTLERVQQEQLLRVGASPSPGRVTVDGDDVGGREAGIVAGFAESLGVEVEWTVDGETELVAAMERGELDVIIAGLQADSPWSGTVSVTRAYASSTDPQGETVKHVLAVPLGENAMLVRLERYLDEEG